MSGFWSSVGAVLGALAAVAATAPGRPVRRRARRPDPHPDAGIRVAGSRVIGNRGTGTRVIGAGGTGTRATGHDRVVGSAAVASLVARMTGAAGGLRRAARRPPSPSLDRRLAAALASGAAVAAVALASPVGGPVGGAVAGVVVWVALGWRARAVVHRRERTLADEAPDLAELFRIAVGAGLTVHLAVETVAPRRLGLSGAALAEVPLATSRGERLADALDRWAKCGEPIRPLAAALAAAERYGEPLGPVLERVTADARLLRRRRAEEAARRLPVVLLFPLVCCVLPAFVLLAVAPLLLVALPELPH